MRGLGTDLIEVSRVGALLSCHGSRFRERVFSAGEQAGAGPTGASGEAAALACRWAAKEAFLKALGAAAAGVPLSAVEVRMNADGVPALCLHGAAAEALAAMGGRSAHLSFARAGDWAAALVAIA